MQVPYEKGPKGVVNYAKAILFDATYAHVPKSTIKKFKSM